MAKIKTKQIDGAVDLNSEQFIFAPKYFFSGLGTVAGTDTHSIYIRYGFIYWLQSIHGFVVTENDLRLGVSPVTGLLVYQRFINGAWEDF